MDKDAIEKLIEKAVEAKRRSYSPYSNFKVGAALLAKNGQVYTGCNIENAAYSPTNCAERTAFFKAVSEGVRDFEAIAIVGGEGEKLCPPCGVCLQVMAEFCDPQTFIVILASEKGGRSEHLLKELLPMAFGLSGK